MSLQIKIQGTLGAAAIADAMGAATENLTFDQIRTKFNGKVSTFLKPEEGAFALGNEAGQVTDDFSQIYTLCHSIIENRGVIDSETVKTAILKWSENTWYFDRFAGPTTRSAIAMYKNPDQKMAPLPGAMAVDYASKATNGAAMKIAPAGILNPGDIEKAIQEALIITQVTHDNALAISGAAAVATAVSAYLCDHATVDQLVAIGIYGACRGEELGKVYSREVGGPSVVERMKLAYTIVNESGTHEEKLQRLAQIIGSGLHISEAVPCAFGIIALNKQDPFNAIIDAVNVGYDTDTIATIVGSMVGALIDPDDERFTPLFRDVQSANSYDLTSLAESLANVVNENDKSKGKISLDL